MLTYPAINPIVFEFGPFKIRWYGISYVAGILLAWWLLRLRAARYHLTHDQVADLVFYATVGIIVGGRLGSVLFYNLSYYLHHPLEYSGETVKNESPVSYKIPQLSLDNHLHDLQFQYYELLDVLFLYVLATMGSLLETTLVQN